MAFSVPFPEANIRLTGPQGEADPDVYTVHARRLDGTVVTCWQLTPEDIAEIIETGSKKTPGIDQLERYKGNEEVHNRDID